MATKKATTVVEYLKELPKERRVELDAVMKVVRANLPKGYEEGVLYGIVGWYVPLKRFPTTYNKQPLGVAGLAAQKNYNSLYLMGAYGDPKLAKRFEAATKKAGKKLDMGKSCVRFKTADDLALDAVAEVIAAIDVEKMIEMHEAVHAHKRKKKA